MRILTSVSLHCWEVLDCAMSTWLSSELCFPDTCFLYDSRLGLARRGTCSKYGRCKWNKGGGGLETFFAVRCGDGDTAVPDGSWLVLTLLCSTSSLSPQLLALLISSSQKPTPWCLAVNPQGQLLHKGNSFPWSSPGASPHNPPSAAGHVYWPRFPCKLWGVSLSQSFRTDKWHFLPSNALFQNFTSSPFTAM